MENREKLEKLATTLAERETMDGRDVEELVKGEEESMND
jgi:ATP-dependent Zn protease